MPTQSECEGVRGETAFVRAYDGATGGWESGKKARPRSVVKLEGLGRACGVWRQAFICMGREGQLASIMGIAG